MLVEDKFFSQDKNYLLKTVQAFSKDYLLHKWLKAILKAYHQQHNPMGLEDDFTIELQQKIGSARVLLESSYDLLAAVYRLNHGDNQLSFQWDGRTHMEVYDAEWKSWFEVSTAKLSLIKEIQRPILRYAVSNQQTNNDFLKQSIRRGIFGFFKVRLRSRLMYQLSA